MYVGQEDTSVHELVGNIASLSEWWVQLLFYMGEMLEVIGFNTFLGTLTRFKPKNEVIAVTTLLERWSDTTHTFLLPFGEMTITSLDFIALTRVRFDGVPEVIVWQAEDPLVATLRDYTLPLLRRGESTIHLSFLMSLVDLNTVASFAFGPATLCQLYHFMDSCYRDGARVGSFAYLLLIWVHEYHLLGIGAPTGPLGGHAVRVRELPPVGLVSAAAEHGHLFKAAGGPVG
ncbi:conserved hypothetical protein [Ricinus communis]|uniref:Aminotransferase-like plant mobile domain-containing protein n=1 Tax=Ricinus communis TaxID=3988 RepID=B9SK13_RICCO|nr:conserved hypothetical protein [Ricinus communis]